MKSILLNMNLTGVIIDLTGVFINLTGVFIDLTGVFTCFLKDFAFEPAFYTLEKIKLGIIGAFLYSSNEKLVKTCIKSTLLGMNLTGVFIDLTGVITYIFKEYGHLNHF